VTRSPSNGLSLSQSLYNEAKKHAPGGVHSNVRLGMKPFPLFFKRAQGAHLWDVDGNEYIDYALGMGPVILGHAVAEVNEAIGRCIAEGQLYAGQHEEELLLARIICEIVPCAEMVRLSLSGSEAVQAALRAARAATGRKKIIKFEGHYHGWFDNVDVSVHPSSTQMGAHDRPHAVPESLGQPAESYSSIIPLPWNDAAVFAERLKKNKDDIAAVIMEPIMCNTSVILPRPGFLEGVRELCSRHGVILIFDEVITGFRVGFGGAGELLKVKPDLAVFAKAMGNGFPISCLAGRRDLMEQFAGGVAHAGTYNSNRLSCAASLATLNILRCNDSAAYSAIGLAGSALIKGLRKIATETGIQMLVQGLPSVFHTTFTVEREITDYRTYSSSNLDLQTQFATLLRERGVNITGRGTWFISASHTLQDVADTLETVKEVLASPELSKAVALETAKASS
jgi:glutamate-1-semialdehyde 2,1-aminomutase